EVTAQARLEVKSAAHAVAAQVSGQVVETGLAIGREVRAGEVLVVLDSEAEHRAIKERRARRDALEARLQALLVEIRAEEAALAAQRQARAVAIVESHARVTRAETEAQFAKRQAERSARLRPGNAISPEEFERHLKESTASQAAVVVLT